MSAVRQTLREMRRALRWAALFSACAAILLLALPLLALQLVEAIVPGGDVAMLAPAAGLAAVSVAAAALLLAIRDRIVLRASLWLGHVLGGVVAKEGVTGARDVSSSDVLAAVDRLARVLPGDALRALLDAPRIVIAIAAVAVLSPSLAIIGAGGVLVAVVGALLRPRLPDRTATTGPLQPIAAADDRFVRALGLTGAVANAWEQADRRRVARTYDAGRSAINTRATHTLAGGVTAIAALTVGSAAIMAGDLTIGALLACLLALSAATDTARRITAGWDDIVSAQAAAGWLMGIDVMRGDAHAAAAGDPVLRHGLVARSLTLRHAGRAKPVLEGINLDVAPGTCLLVAGIAGCGKSTLAAAIAGAVASEDGEVMLDGLPIDRWHDDPEPLIGLMAEAPLLIGGTVADNIMRCAPHDAAMAELASERAGVGPILRALPQGLATRIDVGGSDLTTRERHAIALARALAGQPRLVVLDEPERALGAGGAATLARTLLGLKHDGAVIVMVTRDPTLGHIGDSILQLDGASSLDHGAEVTREALVARASAAPRPAVAAQRRALH